LYLPAVRAILVLVSLGQQPTAARGRTEGTHRRLGDRMSYHHTQRGELHWVLTLLGAAWFLAAWMARHHAAATFSLMFVAAVCFLLSLSLQTLTVRDEGEHLRIRFGPLPLFQRRIAYRDVTAVAVDRLPARSGAWRWLLLRLPRCWGTYRVAADACVRLSLEGDRVVCVGSDDADNLAAFVRQRIAAAAAQSQAQA
jgi:hypothetical protein